MGLLAAPSAVGDSPEAAGSGAWSRPEGALPSEDDGGVSMGLSPPPRDLGAALLCTKQRLTSQHRRYPGYA